MSHLEEETPKKEEAEIHHESHIFVKKILPDSEEKKDIESSAADVLDTEKPGEKKDSVIPRRGHKKYFSKTKGINSQKTVGEELAAIYEDENGNLPDMKTFVRGKKKRKVRAFVFLAFSLLFLIGVSWLGFAVLQPRSQFSEQDIVISISGPEEAAIGQELNYRVRYRNAQNFALKQAGLDIKYPEQFRFVSSTKPASNEDNSHWDLGFLGPQESGYFDIRGVLIGDAGSNHSFRLFFNYQPENFSSTFQKVETAETKLAGAPYTLALKAPSETHAGAEEIYEVVLESVPEFLTGQKPDKIVLRLEPEGEFSILSAEPELADKTKQEWIFSELKAAQSISIKGVFTATGSEEAAPALRFSLSGLYPDREVLYLSERREIKLNDLDILLRTIVNGSAEDLDTQPGDFLNVSIILENSGTITFEELKLRTMFEGPSFNKSSIYAWQSLEDPLDGDIVGEQTSEELRRGYISWSKKHQPELAQLSPGEKITIDVRLPVRDSEQIDLGAFLSYVGSISTQLAYSKPDSDEVETLSSNTVGLSFHSDTRVEVRDEKEQKNGVEKHNITWLLKNSFHDLKDIELSTDLYGDLSFDESSVSIPAGKIEYKAEDKKLIWRIDSMPRSLDVLALEFSISLNKRNPTQSNLTSHVRGQALDIQTGRSFIVVGDEILLE
ncbi:MAG: hypothetical protein HYY51_01670 [Candidatus Magasanikbacteria bacterium]|nr:hypothetical protein [Candidatus Magasanikbacteria bacterium]